jgi:diguanylate cyclase (GGDEF)-like protein/PAS domain S-box-containing protein
MTDHTERHTFDDPLQQALLEYATEFVIFVSDTGELLSGVGEGLHSLGYDPVDRFGHHIAEHLHPDDLPDVLDLIERARVTPDFRETIHARARRVDGTWIMYEATVIGVSGHPVLGQGAVIRVRELASPAVSGAARGDDRRFMSLAESLPSGILSADARGWVVYCNHTAQQILNLPAEQIHGRGWIDVVQADDLPDVMDAAGLVIRSGSAQQASFRIRTGLFTRWASAKFVPLGDDERRTGWIATLDDITDRRRAESQLAHKATHDPLTELPNRTLLEDRLEQACARLRRDQGWVSVLFVDLDDFKQINDTLGHPAGDGVLREVGRRLRGVLRPADTVSRLGGHEFVAVCEGIGEPEAARIAARICDAVEVPMLISGQRVNVTASVGSSSTCDPLQDPAELLVWADQAMYRAKRGRGARGDEVVERHA